jgi:hypothetical protein
MTQLPTESERELKQAVQQADAWDRFLKRAFPINRKDEAQRDSQESAQEDDHD